MLSVTTTLCKLAGCWLLGFSLVNGEDEGSSYWENYWPQTKEFEAYQQKKKQLRCQYRKNLTSALNKATRAELYLLKFDESRMPAIGLDPLKFFQDGSGAVATRIFSKKVLQKKELRLLVSAMQQQLKQPDSDSRTSYNGALYGVRIYQNEKQLFDSSFFFASETYWLQYPDGRELCDLHESFMKVLNRLLPVPSEMQKQFDQRYNE